MRLTARFPNFGEVYDALRMRELVRHLEALFSRIEIDTTSGAYNTTGNITLGAQDELVLVDTSGGSVTVTLPEISDDMIKNKREFEVVKVSVSGIVTVDPSGTDTIVADTDVLMHMQWTALRFRATTGNWVIV